VLRQAGVREEGHILGGGVEGMGPWVASRAHHAASKPWRPKGRGPAGARSLCQPSLYRF